MVTFFFWYAIGALLTFLMGCSIAGPPRRLDEWQGAAILMLIWPPFFGGLLYRRLFPPRT